MTQTQTDATITAQLVSEHERLGFMPDCSDATTYRVSGSSMTGCGNSPANTKGLLGLFMS